MAPGGVDSARQIVMMAYFLALGVLLCVFHDLLVILRCLRERGRGTALMGDLLFFGTLSVTTYLAFLIFCNGSVRGYLLLCEGFGFFGWRYAVSPFLRKPLCVSAARLGRLLSRAGRRLRGVFRAFGGRAAALGDSCAVFCKKIRFRGQNCEKNTCKKSSGGV